MLLPGDALEDQIAMVDEGISYANAYGLGLNQREALWRQRNDLLNALYQVRYSEAQRFGN